MKKELIHIVSAGILIPLASINQSFMPIPQSASIDKDLELKLPN